MIPQKVIKEGLKLAEGSTIFGKPFNDLTKEEAIAMAAYGFDMERKTREERNKRIDFLMDLDSKTS